MASALATVMGVVLVVSNGDSQSSYTDPSSFTPSGTSLSALGAVSQEKLGIQLRDLYLDQSSSSAIRDVSAGIFNPNQVEFNADNGDLGNVVYESAMALAQGLWPATTLYNSTLANGTFFYGPLGGYQFIPITSVDPSLDISMQGWTDCNTYNDAVTSFTKSSAFNHMASENEDFLLSLPQYLGGREVTLDNMAAVYDFMMEQYTFDGDFAASLPEGYMEQARALADWEQYNSFTSPSLDGIGNIAGRTLLPMILNSISRISSFTDPLMIAIAEVQYEPFLSLFNMTNVAAQNPELAAMVDFSSVLAFEVRDASFLGSAEPVVRLRVKNGTDDFVTWPFLDQNGDVPVSMVLDALWPAAINDTAAWCSACNNDADRGCGTVVITTSSSSRLSALGAGFVGAGTTIALFALAIGLVLFLGIFSYKNATVRRRRSQDAPTNRASTMVRTVGAHIRRSSIAKVPFNDSVPLDELKGESLPAYHQ